jgi:uncharacterized membrane protein YczE
MRRFITLAIFSVYILVAGLSFRCLSDIGAVPCEFLPVGVAATRA